MQGIVSENLHFNFKDVSLAEGKDRFVIFLPVAVRMDEDGDFMFRFSKQGQNGLAVHVAFLISAGKRALVRDKSSPELHGLLHEGFQHAVAFF